MKIQPIKTALKLWILMEIYSLTIYIISIFLWTRQETTISFKFNYRDKLYINRLFNCNKYSIYYNVDADEIEMFDEKTGSIVLKLSNIEIKEILKMGKIVEISLKSIDNNYISLDGHFIFK